MNSVLIDPPDNIRFKEEDHSYEINVDGIWHPAIGVSALLETISKTDFSGAKMGMVKTIKTRVDYWYHHYAQIPPENRSEHLRNFVSKDRFGFSWPIWPEKYDVWIPQDTMRKIEKYWETKKTEDLQGVDISRVPHRTLGSLTLQNIQDVWTEKGNVARDRGTKLHKEIEEYLKEGAIPDEPSGLFYIFLRFFSSNPHKYAGVELRLCNQAMRLCGTTDFVAFDDTTNTFIIGDWKCTPKIWHQDPKKDEDADTKHSLLAPFKHLKNTSRNKYILQLNLYAYMFEILYGHRVSKLELVVFHPDETKYVMIELPNVRESEEFKLFIKNREKMII